jgi:hypothetical protein
MSTPHMTRKLSSAALLFVGDVFTATDSSVGAVRLRGKQVNKNKNAKDSEDDSEDGNATVKLAKKLEGMTLNKVNKNSTVISKACTKEEKINVLKNQRKCQIYEQYKVNSNSNVKFNFSYLSDNKEIQALIQQIRRKKEEEQKKQNLRLEIRQKCTGQSDSQYKWNDGELQAAQNEIERYLQSRNEQMSKESPESKVQDAKADSEHYRNFMWRMQWLSGLKEEVYLKLYSGATRQYFSAIVGYSLPSNVVDHSLRSNALKYCLVETLEERLKTEEMKRSRQLYDAMQLQQQMSHMVVDPEKQNAQNLNKQQEEDDEDLYA